MKIHRKITIILISVIISISVSGCFGSFQLTRSAYNWNQNVTSDKFAQTLIFYGMNIVPVYPFVGFLDVVIFNLIEFWTGTNPIAMQEGEYEYQRVEHEGQLYEFMATKNQFTISKINGSSVENLYTICFDKDTQVFNVYVNNKDDMLLGNLQKK